MSRPILIITACLALIGCQKEEKGKFTSPNGQEFAFLARPDAEIVAIQIAFPMDWTLDQGRNPAVAHIAADVMVAGGAEGFSPEEVLETMQDLGAEAFLYPEMTSLRGGLNVRPEHLDGALTLANAVLRAPRFEETWMRRSIDSFVSDFADFNAQSATQGYYALRLAMMGDTAYVEGQSLTDGAAIAAVTAQMARDWHAETIKSGRVLVAVSGPITAKQAAEAVDKLFAGIPRAEGGFSDPMPRPYQARQILLHVPQAEKTTLTMVAPIPPSVGTADYQDILGVLALSGDDQSLLFQGVRNELRASYGLNAALDMYARNNRILAISGEVDTDKTAATRDMIVKIYGDMATVPLDPAQLTRWKDLLSDGFTQSIDDTTNRATVMVTSMLQGLDPFLFEKTPEWLASLDAQSVMRRYAQDYPTPQQVTIMAVSPDAAALAGACVITEPRAVLDCP